MPQRWEQCIDETGHQTGRTCVVSGKEWGRGWGRSWVWTPTWSLLSSLATQETPGCTHTPQPRPQPGTISLSGLGWKMVVWEASRKRSGRWNAGRGREPLGRQPTSLFASMEAVGDARELRSPKAYPVTEIRLQGSNQPPQRAWLRGDREL